MTPKPPSPYHRIRRAPAPAAQEIVNRLEKKKPCYLIDPRSSRWLGFWDVIASCALIFTAFVTPYEVAFIEPAHSWREVLFLVNRAIDAIFIIDMALQFFVMFEEAGESMVRGSVWVARPCAIARHYLTGWFPLDFVSVAVSGFDFVTLFSDSQEFSDLKILRVLRVLRLIKLARLLRASRILKRYETRMAINYGVLTLVSAVINVVVVSHWLACVWTLQVTMQDYLMQTCDEP